MNNQNLFRMMLTEPFSELDEIIEAPTKFFQPNAVLEPIKLRDNELKEQYINSDEVNLRNNKEKWGKCWTIF